MKAFLTGSQAYGTPHEESDVDIVLRMDIIDTDKMIKALIALGQTPEHVDYGDGQSSIKIGALNLIVCHTDKRYTSWVLGTAALNQENHDQYPMRRTRGRAIEVFSGLRDMLGLKNGKQ